MLNKEIGAASALKTNLKELKNEANTAGAETVHISDDNTRKP
jgi:hypothetical protein